MTKHLLLLTIALFIANQSFATNNLFVPEAGKKQRQRLMSVFNSLEFDAPKPTFVAEVSNGQFLQKNPSWTVIDDATLVEVAESGRCDRDRRGCLVSQGSMLVSLVVTENPSGSFSIYAPTFKNSKRLRNNVNAILASTPGITTIFSLAFHYAQPSNRTQPQRPPAPQPQPQPEPDRTFPPSEPPASNVCDAQIRKYLRDTIDTDVPVSQIWYEFGSGEVQNQQGTAWATIPQCKTGYYQFKLNASERDCTSGHYFRVPNYIKEVCVWHCQPGKVICTRP